MTGSISYRLARRPLRLATLATNTESSASMRSDTPQSRFPLLHASGSRRHFPLFRHLQLRHFRLCCLLSRELRDLRFCQFGACLALTARVRTYCRRKEALCHWFSYPSAGGTSGTAFCGFARDSDCWIPCVMACGWRIADRKVVS